MAHSAVMTHHGAMAHQGASPSETNTKAEPDPGPWLALLGPLTLFLTVVAVSWLSMISF